MYLPLVSVCAISSDCRIGYAYHRAKVIMRAKRTPYSGSYRRSDLNTIIKCVGDKNNSYAKYSNLCVCVCVCKYESIRFDTGHFHGYFWFRKMNYYNSSSSIWFTTPRVYEEIQFLSLWCSMINYICHYIIKYRMFSKINIYFFFINDI
jgi:hypothetical protein